MTDPQQAAEFVAATGVDALAVAVGNVHGFTKHPVRLDLERLAAIHESVPVPLVLHGASGLPVEELHGALARGVAKVNVNAELRRAYLEAVRVTLPSALPAPTSSPCGRQAATRSGTPPWRSSAA
jgi:tagatose 1,6-diphosphate aldolase GatY/KbaY